MLDETLHKIFVFGGIFLISSLSVFLLLSFFDFFSDVNISFHGFLAMFLGCFFSFLVISLLITLTLISNRQGYDDRVISFDLDEDFFK
tara:strand:- start:1088 stop:1351 length:264 start_codon:yes stop_codon:yes gene_type:complete